MKVLVLAEGTMNCPPWTSGQFLDAKVSEIEWVAFGLQTEVAVGGGKFIEFPRALSVHI